MRQICNLAYAILIEDRTTAQIAELDVLLSGPEEKEAMIERQNQAAMKELQAMGGVGMLIQPPPGGPRPKRMPKALRNSGEGDGS